MKKLVLILTIATASPSYAHGIYIKGTKPVFVKAAKTAFVKIKPSFVKVKSVFVKPPKTLVTKQKGFVEGTNLGDNDGDEANFKEIEGFRP